MAADLPVIVTSAGAQPTPPATLLAQLIAAVSATNPGYTVLPGALIEDISSTDVAAMAVCDQARVDAINSITPYGANDFVLDQLGQIYIGPGSAPAVPTNTSVNVQFTATNTVDSSAAPGYVISIGFIVSDGTFQYIVQDGGVTDSDGLVTLFCQASVAGSWTVPPSTVINIVTSVPTGITLTCTNPLAGVSGLPAETSEQFRGRVLQAGQAISQGMTTMLKTLLGNVTGVSQRLVSVRQQTGGWSVICGGGDPYEVAGAIFDALFDISTLVGSTISVTNITQANPGVVTTDLNHGLTTGQSGVVLTGVLGMTQINGLDLTVTVVDEKTFNVGISTNGFSPYTSGGVVSPNDRNVTVSLLDYPDSYSIPFIDPPQQTVTITISWNTTLANFVASASVAQAVAPAVAAYINAIVVGQPINLLVIEEIFTTAVAGLLTPAQISVMNITVLINGVTTAPGAGTFIVNGDPESYFQASSAGINVVQA